MVITITILRRTVALSGRSRSFANDEPVTLPVLQDLARELVDIHSQHQTLRLAEERFRLDALDLWAGTMELREECGSVWMQVLDTRRKLATLQEREAKAMAEQEYNSARWERLNEAKLQAGELETLEAEQNELAHAEQIKETLCGVEELLSPASEESASPAHLLREASRLLEKAGAFIPSLTELAQRVTSARLEVEDIASEVAAVNSRTEASPERLQAVEEQHRFQLEQPDLQGRQRRPRVPHSERRQGRDDQARNADPLHQLLHFELSRKPL